MSAEVGISEGNRGAWYRTIQISKCPLHIKIQTSLRTTKGTINVYMYGINSSKLTSQVGLRCYKKSNLGLHNNRLFIKAEGFTPNSK